MGKLPPSSWIWATVPWWFLALVAYYVVFGALARATDVVPFVVLVVAMTVVYFIARNFDR